ncbi:coat protein [Thelebolus microsporus totivirus 1]|nr:coat protein [Thelebolus microsporus totivirus 1]
MSLAIDSHLAGVLTAARQAAVTDDATYRKYVAVVHSTLTMNRDEDSSLKRIMYEVGRRYPTSVAALARLPDDVLRIDGSYPSNSVMSNEMAGLAKKFSNFSASFAYGNLAGVVERLAKGLAADGLYATGCNTTHLRGGAALRVHALGTYDGPVSAHLDTVFIPRLADSVITPDVFSVLASAVAGEGGTVATDLVELDAVTRQPIVREVDTYAFARACVDALRLLGANMAACDAGDLYAYALTRGIHSVLSVVSHTDEGGVLRDILRCSGFSAPFGGVHLGLEEYTALPALSTSSPAAIAAYADAIALSTAALVAHCDPGVIYNGSWFPTVLQGAENGAPEVRPGEHQAGTDAMALRNRNQLKSEFGSFAALYTSGLTKLFGFGHGSGMAARHLSALPASLTATNRHLRHASVAPYFWIEPTSLIAHDFLGSPAEQEGFASYATKNQLRSVPAWESIRSAGPSDFVSSGYVVAFRSARACPLLAHLQGHADNGLGSLVVRQLDPNGVIHPGACAANPQVRDRVEASMPLSSYLWVRGQSALPAPAEFINLAVGMGIQARHVIFSDDGDMSAEHLPLADEFVGAEVTFTVSTPAGVASGPLGVTDNTARRGRTKATRSLAGACLRTRIYGTATLEELPMLTTAPPTFLPTSHAGRLADQPFSAGGGTIARVQAGASARLNRAGNAPTVPVRAVVHNSASNGPAPLNVARAAAGAGAGAGRPAGQARAPPAVAARNDDSDDDDDAVPAPPAGPAAAADQAAAAGAN